MLVSILIPCFNAERWVAQAIDSALASVLGLPAAAVAAIAVTLVTPAPGRHVLELVRVADFIIHR